MIDLVVRTIKPDSTFNIHFATQYKEYERASLAANLKQINQAMNEQEQADLTCIVNPNNPTGEYKSIKEMKDLIKTLKQNSTLLIDESMHPWIGKDWKDHSFTSQYEFTKQVLLEKGIRVFVIHSWTKLWACTGLRIGSLVCPNEQIATSLRKCQVPVIIQYLFYIKTILRRMTPNNPFIHLSYALKR